ncbi:hypothetical protein JCM10213_007900 [Rhodosporidiobolus nylandii]
MSNAPSDSWQTTKKMAAQGDAPCFCTTSPTQPPGERVDTKRMHQEFNREAHEKLSHDTVHTFEGQEPTEAERNERIRESPVLTDEAKLNALDDHEALPHHGFLRGDL